MPKAVIVDVMFVLVALPATNTLKLQPAAYDAEYVYDVFNTI